jgi:hypothetical protein
MIILVTDRDPVIRFAAHELGRYLRRATGTRIPIVAAGSEPRGAVALRLGLIGPVAGDDRIRIVPHGRGYRLAGSNPRSVLFAVYRYLHELGFRWIRPGPRGEIVPRLKSPVRPGIRVDESPSYRYRTICIEGAPSGRHVTDLIDWMAKQGMNGYFVQFDLAHGEEFWERWYRHADNAHLKPEPLGPARSRRIGAAIEAAIAKRGLRFESMGHGWIAATLDVADKRGIEKTSQIPAGRRNWLPRYLEIYLEIMERLIPALDAYLTCEPDCGRKYEVVFDYVRRQEKVVHPALDVWQCVRVLGAYVSSMEREGQKAWA